MSYERFDSPAEMGTQWAEAKAERLLGVIAARDWPETWERSFDRRLVLPEAIAEDEGHAYREAAHHAACERWLELLLEQREAEAADEAEIESERDAERLLERVRPALPVGLEAQRDGTGLFLLDDRGESTPVSTMAEAWRVVSDYDERYTR